MLRLYMWVLKSRISVGVSDCVVLGLLVAKNPNPKIIWEFFGTVINIKKY